MLHKNANRLFMESVGELPVQHREAEDFFGEDPRVIAARPENQRRQQWAIAFEQMVDGMEVCAALLMCWILLPAQLQGSLVNAVTRRSGRNRPPGVPGGNGNPASRQKSPIAIRTPGDSPGTLQHIKQGADGNDAASPRGNHGNP